MARPSNLTGWRPILILLGIALLAAAVWMEFEILSTSAIKTETTAGAVVTTKTEPPAPSATLVTGAWG